MAATPSGADGLANTLMTSLIAGKNFTVPVINLDDPLFGQPGSGGPLNAPIDKLATADLTTGTVGGSGVFDQLMASLVKHLKVEYDANRIAGAEYTKAYQAMIAAALEASTGFLLGKDQAYWQALLAQQQAKIAEVQAVTARVELETARLALARTHYEAATAEANYALTKLKLSSEDAGYAILVAQKTGVDTTNDNLVKQGEGLAFTNANLLPKQADLLKEQIEVQRAQTLDKRTDNANVVGLIGKQKDLYAQQITSYQRDAETKAAKMFLDGWITQKTIDEGLLPPTQLNNSNIDGVLTKLRANLALS